MSTNDLDQIERLFRLRESGALSQAEFEAEKTRVLEGQTDEAEGGEQAFVEEDHASGALPITEVAAPYEDPSSARWKLWVGLLVFVIMIVGAATAWFTMKDRSSSGHSNTVNLSTPREMPHKTKAAVEESALALSAYQWATSTEVLGVTPEFLTSKLGPARQNDVSTLDFEVAGCDVRYQIENKAVVYFDAAFNGSCKPSLKGLNAADTMNLSHATTLAEVEQRAGGLIIADCLEMCGNAADPAQYLFVEGPHADNFINVAVMADPRASAGTEKWASAIRAANGLAPDNELPTQSFACGNEGQDVALQEVGPNRIGRVLVGPGLSMENLTQCGVDTE